MSARACLGVCVLGMCSCRTRACAGTLASALSRDNGRVRTQALSEAEARPRLDEKVAKDIHLSVSVLRQRQAAHAQVLGSPCLRRFPGTLALLLAKMRWVIDMRCIPAGCRQQRGVRVLQKGPTKTSVAWQFLRVQKLEREREQKRGQAQGAFCALLAPLGADFAAGSELSPRASVPWVGISAVQGPRDHRLGDLPSPVVWVTRFTS